MVDYDHKKIETKWREAWEKAGVYEPSLGSSKEISSDKKKKVDSRSKQPFYNLMMFPYPSAEGLHVGNVSTFTGVDAYGRFKRMQGYDVFEPIGLDGFGIHSENYALKIGKHPTEQAKVSEKRFYEQLKLVGNGFSWQEKLETYNPDYYRWTQWLFIKMFRQGIAYRGKSMVNWCPSCKTVLADEQVEGGVCERCKNEVEKREMEQWFFKITEYADRLLDNIDGKKNSKSEARNSKQKDFGPVGKNYDPRKEGLRWPEKIKTAQRQWIGRSEGAEIDWEIVGSKRLKGKKITTFTTRLDTVFGATFLVLSPEHPLVGDLISGSEAHNYVQKALLKTEKQRKVGEREKTGVPTVYQALNPLSGKPVPIWIADFVLMEYGSGAIMGVPAHDERDFAFARENNLQIKPVVDPNPTDPKFPIVALDVSYTRKHGGSIEARRHMILRGELCSPARGILINSEDFSGLTSEDAERKILKRLKSLRLGRKEVNYHLRDWLISRQRYWGPPIPMVFCSACASKGKTFKGSTFKGMKGWWSVPEEDLPVELPHIDDYKPTGDGKAPLENASNDWLYTECPECGGKAKRETDVSDTFLDSSWYFLRYPSVGTQSSKLKTQNHSSKLKAIQKLPWDREVTRKWLPVDAYIGGAEHAVLHLLYSRFVTMALNDWGYLDFEEPFPFLYGHGLIIKDGAKMSKSRGNVVVPDEYIKKFGADALRMYLRFVGPFDQGGDFRDTGIVGIRRFLERVWRLFKQSDKKKISGKTDRELEGILHRTIKNVTEDMEKFKFNTCVAKLMTFVNAWEKGGSLSEHDAAGFLRLLAPFVPFMSEELWQEMIGSHSCSDKNCLIKKVSGKDLLESSIHVAKWPDFDEKLTISDEVEVVVQVSGKLRARFTIDSNRAKKKEEIVALAKKDKAVKKYLDGKKIRKTIWVPGKLVNFVVN